MYIDTPCTQDGTRSAQPASAEKTAQSVRTCRHGRIGQRGACGCLCAHACTCIYGHSVLKSAHIDVHGFTFSSQFGSDSVGGSHGGGCTQVFVCVCARACVSVGRSVVGKVQWMGGCIDICLYSGGCRIHGQTLHDVSWVHAILNTAVSCVHGMHTCMVHA